MMDSRLFKAAILGDVSALGTLIEEDPLILERVASTVGSAETPLHVASLAGRTEFVKEILSLKPSFAWELNQDGFSPLHIASASGNVEIVRELLKQVGPQLCLIKDKDGRNPLHIAAIKGRVPVILELLAWCPNEHDAIQEVTPEGETALHLAVKNKQVDALKALLERLKKDGDDQLINAKDNQGNTILQWAMATRQLQVINLLKNQTMLDNNIIEAAASGEQFQGGTATELPAEGMSVKVNKTDKGIAKSSSNQPQQQEGHDDDDDESSKGIWEEVEEMVLVVASLIATVTYQAGLSPPQTIWKENMKWDFHKCILHHHSSSLSSCPDLTYFIFMSFNTAGFFAAVFLIFFFRNPSYVQVLLPVALISMMITYVTLSVQMLPNAVALLIIYLVTLAIFIYCLLAVEVIKTILHTFYGFAAGKVSSIAKAVARRRKPSSTSTFHA